MTLGGQRVKIKTNFWGIVIGVVSLLIAIYGTHAIFKNWESQEDFTMKFSVNEYSKTSSYYSVDGDLKLRVFQESGNSNHRYTIYEQLRNDSSWKTVVSSLQFPENEEWNGENYDLNPGYYKDLRIKVNRTAGVNAASTLVITLGEPE